MEQLPALHPWMLAHLAPLAQAEGRGLLVPILLLLLIVLLNIAVLAVALRLRRFFNRIGDEGDQEQL